MHCRQQNIKIYRGLQYLNGNCHVLEIYFYHKVYSKINENFVRLFLWLLNFTSSQLDWSSNSEATITARQNGFE